MHTLWKKIYTLSSFEKKNALPETPGVYFFLDKQKEVLYIGKATSLHDRVKSYFTQDLFETRGPKIQSMRERIAFIAFLDTDSVLEALILESNLIKAKQPPYNTDAKDDKSYYFVVITKEIYPRVLMVRGRDIEQKKFIEKIKYLFGPFPSGSALRIALKIVRKIFPFRDMCVPHSEKKCFSAQMHLCPGVCVGDISPEEYAKTINHIRLFFEGHKSDIVKQLEKEMKQSAQALHFEHANEIKKMLFGLRHIEDVALTKDDLREKHMHRIEAYDVAHLGGKASVGVMTVVEQSRSNPSEYRQFILKEQHNGNDLTALKEILSRRFKHKEWRLPEIIVVDGSWPQINIAKEVLETSGLSLPLIGVVKNAQHKPDHFVGEEMLMKRFEKEILLANDEAHRFAITFHRKRLEKEFLQRG